MKNFTDVEELVSYMYDKVEKDIPITVVVNKDLAVEVMQEFLAYTNTELTLVNINTYEYDREYFVSLVYDESSEMYNVSVEPSYNYEKEKYFGADGYVLFHEDVNSRILVDIQSNECAYMTEHDWFTFDDDVDEAEDDEDEVSNEEDTELVENKDSDNQYFVNGEQVTKEEYAKTYDSVQEVCRKAVLAYCEFMDEMNEWRKLLRW